jgi:hypothetical protein
MHINKLNRREDVLYRFSEGSQFSMLRFLEAII